MCSSLVPRDKVLGIVKPLRREAEKKVVRSLETASSERINVIFLGPWFIPERIVKKSEPDS
jgi:hypothetical protein